LEIRSREDHVSVYDLVGVACAVLDARRQSLADRSGAARSFRTPTRIVAGFGPMPVADRDADD